MTRSKALLQMFLALALAFAAGLLVFNWMSGQRQRAAQARPAQAQTATVVVAARALPRGTTLTADMLRTASYPLDSRPEGAFADPAPLAGRVLDTPLGQNEPLTVARLADEGAGAGVSALIAPGHRAMAVKGNKVMGLAGFIRPGDRVDVLVTMVTEGSNPRSFTKLVLENILVLATGNEFEPGKDGEPSSVDTYSLEVDPEEGELLALAANYGTLNFALRKEGDESRVLTRGADIAAALAANRHAERASAPRKARTTHQVEIITGTQRSVQRF